MEPLEYEIRKRDTIALIIAAFDGVERGAGVTLHEALVIDSYGSDKERAKARKRDTEARWQDVPYEQIANCSEALHFFDPAGFCYYLPAYLVWYLRHMDSEVSNTFDTVDFVLTAGLRGPIGDHHYQRFGAITLEQSNAVARCLILLELHQKTMREQEAASLDALQKAMFACGEWTREEVEASKDAYRQHREEDEMAARALQRYWGQFL